MFPGEPNASMDLDIFRCGMEIGFGAVALGKARHCGKLIVINSCAPCCVVGSRLCRFDFQQHVGALVLDCLEGTDRASELESVLCVLDRHVEDHLCSTDLFGSERDRRAVEHRYERVPAGAVAAEKAARRRRKADFGLFAGLVHGRQRGPSEP